MKVALINGSPKKEYSHSHDLLRRFASYLSDYEPLYISLGTEKDAKNACFQVNTCDAMVIAAPLYLDGFPSAVLQFMSEMEYRYHGQGIPAAFIINCGVYDGKCAETAVRIAKNWCKKAKLNYVMTVSLGGCEVLENYADIKTGDGVLKALAGAFVIMALGIRGNNTKQDQYLVLRMRQFSYQKSVEKKWKKEIRQNGLSTRDLSYRPVKGKNSGK